MKFLKLKGGSAGYLVWINTDSIVKLTTENDLSRSTSPTYTVIHTVDGKGQRVQEPPEYVLSMLAAEEIS